ncbi:hypothetical protein DJ82_07745 [Halorubrum sp. Ib24]|uniref:hypothetical protein n=1 Tax=unclassified Halorubrum TaxID=2642239 RepID=UPI000B98A792|nr:MULTISPECIES: hypothetical protein [unclassified Halorubrum]OYR39511.1 hypothetical protein DJ75_16735 [Halorubrum sp. Eb13]OYR40343.1 hypothetical protein DJ82_07745 [Halorubrum sp. Ib24]OYR50412.1 hypothetical protein DJ73_16010 [Halorubrum sp. Ea1]
MTGLDHVDTDRLREWLPEVREGETTAATMLTVAYDEGIGAGELASWYGRSTESVEETIAALDSPDQVAEIARLEGVNVDGVDLPFAELEELSVSEAASAIRDRAERE